MNGTAPPRWDLVRLGWAAYVVYYLGRLNFSVAIPTLGAERGLDSVEIGALTAGFFWVYSVGGVVAGGLADRWGPRLLVGLGLAGSAAANVVFGLSASWGVLLVAWTLNGWFQSMGWAPLIGSIPRWVPADSVDRVGATFGSSFVAGSALALAVGGVLLSVSGLTAAFVGPAVIMVTMAIVWWTVSRGANPVRAVPPRQRSAGAGRATITRGLLLLVTVALVGLVYVAMLVWIPLYLVDVHGLSVGSAGTVAALVAAVGIVGPWVGGSWFGRLPRDRAHMLVAQLLAGTAVSLALVPVLDSALVPAIAMSALASALVAATSSIVLGGFAVSTAKGRVATFGGLLALVFNLGGGAGGPLLGRVLQRGSWPAAFITLAAAMMLAVAPLALSTSRRGSKPVVEAT